MKKLLPLFFILILYNYIFSQKDNTNKLFYSLFDTSISNVNTKLSYGTAYKERYIKKTQKNHNFFRTSKFKKGSINYRNEYFYDVAIKYDLVNDIAILKISNLDQHISIVPEKNLIKSFQIDEISFVNTNKYGFLEEILVQKEFSILKKHQKTSKENIDDNYVYHTFKKKKDQFVLFYKSNYYPINSKSDFKKIFPEKKKIISKIFSKNKSLLKNDFKNFVLKLINGIQA